MPGIGLQDAPCPNQPTKLKNTPSDFIFCRKRGDNKDILSVSPVCSNKSGRASRTFNSTEVVSVLIG